MFLKKYIGNKSFYLSVIAISLPMMLQTGITNFVSFLDNIMVGSVGTEEMSAVGIVNQLVFVYNLFIFGAISGAGIFTVQFFGKGDNDGIRYSFRFKIIICTIIAVVGAMIFWIIPSPLINAFLHDGSVEGDIAKTLECGKQYISIATIGLFPYAICQCYGDTLRGLGKTIPPMVAGLGAVIVNLIFNYVLIFGKFGFPVLGVRGAAIATVIARFFECGWVVIYTHVKKKDFAFIVGAYNGLRIPNDVLISMCKKGLPLFVNEALWSFGMTMLTRCYSMRGLDVFAGFNIASTILNLFNIVFMSLGSSVGIIVGKYLGANEFDKAKDADNKLIAFSVVVATITGIIMGGLAPIIPRLYPRVNADAKAIAVYLMLVMACFVPIHAFLHATYFTLRSGGKTLITFLFDSGVLWVVCVPVAYLLVKCTSLTIYWIYPIVSGLDLIKCVVGFVFVKKNGWMNNISVRQEEQV